MTGRFVVGAVLAMAASLAGVRAQQQSVFKSGVDVVFVDVSATRGRVPVRDLTSADFVLSDNGVRQQVEAVSMETVPIDVTLLLDVSGSVEAGVLQGLKRSVDDAARSLGTKDRVRLLTFSHAIRQIFAYRPGGAPPNLDALAAGGATSIYDALASAMMQRHPAGSRQMILVFTDGADSRSFMDAASLRDLAGISEGVVHFAVGLRRGGDDIPHKAQLKDIAAATGGDVTTFRVDGMMLATFHDILDRFRTSYVLRYTPTGVPRAGWHALDVKVTKGNVDIQARKGWMGVN